MGKRLFFLLLCVLSILVSCNESSAILTEIQNAPIEVEEKMDLDYTLQLINRYEHISYIVFHTQGTVSALVEAEGETVKLRLSETNVQNIATKRIIYQLTLEPQHDKIEVFINGESTPFDSATSF